LTDLI